MRAFELRAVGWYILAWGALISGGAFVFFGSDAGRGAAAGAGIAVANWWLLRAILRRAALWNDGVRLAIALSLKSIAALASAAAAVLLLPVNAAGLAFGISALFLGLATFGCTQLPGRQPDTERGT
ncbi:MAG: hypothetical protein MUC50_10525 [Myxococcota bacterium]|jgi:hypothetical protein|nr:hypothetical protein [Myxococcota bacterium]